MGFQCGIVGLPNVGKSTLFNALTSTAAAAAENYPFCTIEPNVGQVPVPDERLEILAKIAHSEKIIPTQLAFVDIAGLVRGASKGEGLGNQFLGHIREVDAILHVLRCFDDDNVTHVEGEIDPLADAEVVNTELMLADLESLERRIDADIKKARGQDKDARARLDLMARIKALLEEGKPARQVEITEEERQVLKELQLLTAKPILYVCNVTEEEAVSGNARTEAVAALAKSEGCESVIISAAIEAELAVLEDEEDRHAFLAEMGLKEAGLDQVIRKGYALLDLITFLTAGPEESRAWTVPRGAMAPEAAGVIHTDFEKGFIRAETIAYDDYVACDGEQGAKEAGKTRLEGKDYVVADGDVMHFRFNV